MTSKHIYYCVYRITNIVDKKYYYGYKSTKVHPSEVIGITYFSSAKGESGKEFVLDQKNNPEKYKYKIVKLFDTAADAINREILLHAKFDVKRHPHFYNKANQTSSKFDTTGIKATDAVKLKMSLSKKGVPKSPQHIKAMSGRKHTPEEIEKIRISQQKPKTKEHRLAMSEVRKGKGIGSKNSNFKNYYITPLGTFTSPGSLAPIISKTSLFRWCTNNEMLISKTSYKMAKWLHDNFSWDYINGKSFKDIGFSTCQINQSGVGLEFIFPDHVAISRLDPR